MSSLVRLLAGLAGACALSACLRLEGPPPFTEDGEPCTSDSQCHPTSACEYDSSASNYVCRVRGGCTTHSQCPTGNACSFGSCLPAECTDSNACGAYACDTARLQCFDSCADNYDCNGAYLCRDGECLSATCTAQTAARICLGAACNGGTCMNEFDCDYYGCAEGYVCDSYQCDRPCSSDANCERYICDVSVGECRTSCSLETDCQPGYVCKDYFCQFDAP